MTTGTLPSGTEISLLRPALDLRLDAETFPMPDDEKDDGPSHPSVPPFLIAQADEDPEDDDVDDEDDWLEDSEEDDNPLRDFEDGSDEEDDDVGELEVDPDEDGDEKDNGVMYE